MRSDSANTTTILHQADSLNLPLDREILFSNNKGIYKKRIEKRQTGLLKNIAFLNNFLKEEERILLITTGFSPASFLKQFLIV